MLVVKKDQHLIHFLICKPKLDQWDQEDLQVCKGLVDPKVSWDHKEKQEIQGHRVLQDQQVLEGCQVCQGRMERLDKMVKLDPLVPQDHLAKEDFLACLVYPDQRGTVASLV